MPARLSSLLWPLMVSGVAIATLHLRSEDKMWSQVIAGQGETWFLAYSDDRGTVHGCLQAQGHQWMSQHCYPWAELQPVAGLNLWLKEAHFSLPSSDIPIAYPTKVIIS